MSLETSVDRNWTNEERVENYSKLLTAWEWSLDCWESDLKNIDRSTFLGNYLERWLDRKIKESKKAIDRLNKKIAFFAARPGESTEMPKHLLQLLRKFRDDS